MEVRITRYWSCLTRTVTCFCICVCMCVNVYIVYVLLCVSLLYELAAVLASQQAAAVAVINPFPPAPAK